MRVRPRNRMRNSTFDMSLYTIVNLSIMIIDSESLGEINQFLYVVIYRIFINESVKEVNVFKNPMPLGVGVSV